MKLSFNATTLRNFDVLQAVKSVSEAGYDGVELSVNDNHLHPYRSSKEQILEVKKLCGDLGLRIACVAAGGPTVLGEVPYEPSLISPDGKARQDRLDVIRRCIEMTQRLDCPTININSGLLKDTVAPERAQEYLLEGLRTIMSGAGDTIVALEPEPNFFAGTTTKAIQVLELINHPQLRLNLDIGHVFVSEEAPYDAVHRSLPYTQHMHIEDIKGGVHFHEIPGEGDIDFRRVIADIVAADYQHYVSVELHNHDQMWQRALDESRAYLLKIYEEVTKN